MALQYYERTRCKGQRKNIYIFLNNFRCDAFAKMCFLIEHTAMYLEQCLFCVSTQNINLFLSIMLNWSIEGSLTLYITQISRLLVIIVCPIVPHGQTILHIPVHCRTGTRLLPHLSTRIPQVLFCNFPTCIPATLLIRCWLLQSPRGHLVSHSSHKTKFFPLSTARLHPVIHGR